MNKAEKKNSLLKRIEILLVLSVLFLVGLIWIKEHSDESFVPLSQTNLYAEIPYTTSGYAQEGDSFIPLNNDPQIQFLLQGLQCDTVVIRFSKELEQDIEVEIYYATDGDSLSELAKSTGILSAGGKYLSVNLPSGQYTTLRVDINGAFHLSSIIAEQRGEVYQNLITRFDSMFGKYITCFVFLIAFFPTVLQNKRDNSQIRAILGEYFFPVFTTVWALFVLEKIINGPSLFMFIAAVLFFAGFRRYYSGFQGFKHITSIPAAIFSFILLIGNSFSEAGSWNLVFGSTRQTAVSFFEFVGCFLILEILISILFQSFEKTMTCIPEETKKNGGILNYIFNKQPFVCCWLLLIFAWVPYLVFFYPGSVSYDMFTQLKMFSGELEFTNGHPPFSTVLMGICLRIGQGISSDNLGIFLYTLLQALGISGAISLIFTQLRDFKTPLRLRVIFFAFYAIFPLFPSNAQCTVKDMMFLAFFVLYDVIYIRFLSNPDLWKTRKCRIIYFGAIISMCFFRKGIIFIVVLAEAAAFFMRSIRQYRKQRVIGTVLCILTITVINNIFFPLIMGVKSVGPQEMLSIPLQQTARYVRDHSSDVTSEEQGIIDRVVRYDSLAEAYNPQISDPVKNLFRCPTAEELIAYFRVWFSQFFRHPGTYIQATIHNSFGYYYPDIGVIDGEFGVYTSIEGSPTVNDGFIKAEMLEKWKTQRADIIKIMRFIKESLGLNVLYSDGFYTWCNILLITYLIKKRKYSYIAAFVPIVGIFLFDLASPLNGSLRYFMPIITMTPMMAGFTWKISLPTIVRPTKS